MGTLRRTAKFVGRQTIGRLPRSSSRIRGPLAIEGGAPVRNVRFRPWPSHHSSTLTHWVKSVGPAFRTVFLSGLEGLPQTRQKEFAARWAEYCGCRHALLLPHGTDALRLALAAAFDHDGLEYGGEVIVPNLSFIACATAALDRRFGVAFVDVDPGTLNIDPAKVEAAVIPSKTRAIMPVHQFGQPADMTALAAVAARHGLKIIEDAAQAHGAVWATGPVGSLGDAAGFSFQSAKNLASGEGGVLTTNDTTLFERAYSMHNAGRTFAAESRWLHDSLGWNIRPTEYQAVLLLDRLHRFDAQQEIRAANFAALHDRLAGIGAVRPLDTHISVRRHGMYMFVLRYQSELCGGLRIDDFVRAVQAEGVPLQRCYETTLSSQQAMQKLMTRRPDYVRTVPTPVADRAVGEIVYLASNLFLGRRADTDDIADALIKVAGRYGRQGSRSA